MSATAKAPRAPDREREARDAPAVEYVQGVYPRVIVPTVANKQAFVSNVIPPGTTVAVNRDEARVLGKVGAITPPAVVVPGAPTAVAASDFGGGIVKVVFSAPASDGGAAIDMYRATATPGGATGQNINTPVYVEGLGAGYTGTFTVQAHNPAGWGPASAASNSVTTA